MGDNRAEKGRRRIEPGRKMSEIGNLRRLSGRIVERRR
jgi:hypothetical protein